MDHNAPHTAERFDEASTPWAFDAIGTLAGLGETELCTGCRQPFTVSALLRGPDGALCLRCDLERESGLRVRQSRLEVSKLLAVGILLCLSAAAIPGVLPLGLVQHQPWHGPAFALGGVLAGTASSLLIFSTLRDLRFDLPAGDPVLLGKHMFTLSFATVVNAVAAGVFAAALFLF